MAPVFGHGRLRLYLLKLLAESPKHGYEIIQQLKERFQGLYAPSAGTVYPRLSRLESEGLIRHETDERGRKVYHITDAGRTELAARADDMDALETEIRESVSSLAEEIRDEVKESARHIQEELRAEAAEARTEARTDSAKSRGGAAHAPAHPPADRSQWGKDEWREWKRAQNDWKEQWKDQWAAQWREHWQDEASRWQRFAQDSVDDWTGRRSRDRADREQLDELRATFMRFRDEVRTMAREHRDDIPVSQDQLNAAREVLERAARELRDIFRG
ncbi:DNA-binding PadR family transcriptional regulator [Catenulispora sp. GAS73]|uniref:PadR family transcriptional regulator n=1 Tax=Catenulispora sp. GAS73 TaxID=3156269 RepID=UPI003510E7BE